MKLRKRTQRRWEQRRTQISKTLIVFSFSFLKSHDAYTIYQQHNTWTITRWIGPSSLSPLIFGNESRIYNQAGEQSLTCDKNESDILWTNFQGKELKLFWRQKWSGNCFLFGIFRMGSSWLVHACLLHFDYLLNIRWLVHKKVQFDKWLISVTIIISFSILPHQYIST